MERDDLSEDLASGSDEFADPEFIQILEVFEDSELVESHHNCGLTDLFDSKDSFEGQVAYHAFSDNSSNIIGSIQFFYNEWLWRGFAEEYRGQIDFEPGLLRILYSEQEFKSFVEAVGTEYMEAAPEERSIVLEIPGEPDLEKIQDTLQKAVELSRFFNSRVSDKTGAQSFQEFTENKG